MVAYELQDIVSSSCNKWNICKNDLISDNNFKCKEECIVLDVACPSTAIMLFTLIFCKNCGDQYVGSATDFKTRFWI